MSAAEEGNAGLFDLLTLPAATGCPPICLAYYRCGPFTLLEHTARCVVSCRVEAGEWCFALPWLSYPIVALIDRGKIKTLPRRRPSLFGEGRCIRALASYLAALSSAGRNEGRTIERTRTFTLH